MPEAIGAHPSRTRQTILNTDPKSRRGGSSELASRMAALRREFEASVLFGIVEERLLQKAITRQISPGLLQTLLRAEITPVVIICAKSQDPLALAG